jgi:hypothetical protein
MGHMGNRKPETPLFLLAFFKKSGRILPWLLSRESELARLDAVVIVREFEHFYSFEPYMNGQSNPRRDVDEVS